MPEHPVLDGISLKLNEQIRHYFHVEHPARKGVDHASGRIRNSRFYHKAQWLEEHVLCVLTTLVDPGTVISYYEAMISFMGRSKYKVLAPNKPISEGYESMMLATLGYAFGYVFGFYLRSASRRLDVPAASFSIPDTRLQRALPLNPTNLVLLHLASLVQNSIHGSRIERGVALYADNRFWNVATLAYLRTQGIGSCGTFRSNARGQSNIVKNELKVRTRDFKKYPWESARAWEVR